MARSRRALDSARSTSIISGCGRQHIHDRVGPGLLLSKPCAVPTLYDNCDSASLRSILPWGADSAPARLFLASSRVDNDDHSGGPPVPSPELVLGIGCSLVAVTYSVLTTSSPNFRCRGRWFKYDCMQGSGVTTSTEFDSDWYLGLQHMFVYLRASMVSFIPLPETDVYRSRAHRGPSSRARAALQGTIMPPAYRSRGHSEHSKRADPVAHRADPPHYGSRSRARVWRNVTCFVGFPRFCAESLHPLVWYGGVDME